MMQPLDLNLGTRPFRNNTLIWIGLLLGFALVGWVSYINYSTWQGESDALEALRQEVNGSERQLMQLDQREKKAAKAVKKYDLDLLASQTARSNDVIMLKAFSWTRLFNRLEKIQPYEVRMQAVRPVFRLGTKKRGRGLGTAASEEKLEDQSVVVTVDGTAKNLKAFLELETALLEDPFFDRVEPERYSRIESGETQFSLRFHYYPNKVPEGPGDEAGNGEESAGTEADTTGAQAESADGAGNEEIG